MDRSFVPSIVPSGDDQTFYLVINNYGTSGTAFAETDVGEADLETTINDLMSGQYSDPVRVVAFNTSEHWAEDASEDVAREWGGAGGMVGWHDASAAGLDVDREQRSPD